MSMKQRQAGKQHQELVQRLCDMMTKEAGDMPADELLAVVAQVCGVMIAYQDQRKYSPAKVIALVNANIEAGNRRAMERFASLPVQGRA